MDQEHPLDTKHPGEEARRASLDHPEDFFTRLAERALGMSPLAQPVIAPAFAPEPGVPAGAGSLEWAEAFQAAGEPAASEAASIPAPGGPIVRQGHGSDPHAPSAAAPVSPAPSTPPAASIPPASPPADASAEPPLLGDRAPGARETSIPVSAASMEPVEPAPAREPARLLVPGLRPAAQPAAAGESISGRQARLPVPSQAPALDLAPPVEAGDYPARREATLPAQPAWSGAEAAQGPPTIRITIGRVEVRAVQSPSAAPAQPAPRPGPALSLEAYLKERNEARR
jgi:hypothetical protein